MLDVPGWVLIVIGIAVAVKVLSKPSTRNNFRGKRSYSRRPRKYNKLRSGFAGNTRRKQKDSDSRHYNLDGTQSPIESKLLDALITTPDLPVPRVQYEIRNKGRLVTVPDFAYPEHRIAIYCDGYAYHGNKKSLEMDARKRNWLQRNDWLVLTYWGRTINNDARACAMEIKEVYQDRTHRTR